MSDFGILKIHHGMIMDNQVRIIELEEQNKILSKQVETLELEVKMLRKLIMSLTDIDSE